MKIAVMQPYFFPYIGYWQLINSVDIFIIYDDVNFVKRGYINRNNILINNQRFSVDPECMGLKMVGYGYATVLLFIGSFEKKFNRKIRLHKIIGILTLSTFFIILVNLFRIVMIVILQSKPETIMHELVGLLSFGVYFILPMYFISKWIIKRQSSFSNKKSQFRTIPNQKITILFTLILISSLAYFNFNRTNYRNIEVDNKSSAIEIANYKKSITPNNVVKFENDKTLIYIKPSCHFFGPDHSPTIC